MRGTGGKDTRREGGRPVAKATELSLSSLGIPMPYNMQAEQSVLGAALMDDTVLTRLITELEAEMFYSQQNRAVFEQMARLFGDNEAVDIVTLVDALAKSEAFQGADDAKVYIARVAETVPAISNVDSYIKIADTNLITGVVDGNDNNRLIGFGVSFPSLTDALQKIGNGKLLPWGWWQIVKALKLHKTDTVDLVLIGVLPEYRSKGANALIFADLIEQYHRYCFKWAEAMPQMETNKGVQSQWQYLESVQHRCRRCY